MVTRSLLSDAHVHVSDENSLRQALALGVTTVLDMFTSEERLKLMKRVEREDPIDIAKVRTARQQRHTDIPHRLRSASSTAMTVEVT